MIKAKISDKTLVVTILSAAFETNKSVNDVIKQDVKRKPRIRFLMSYAFEICTMFGEIYLSDEKTACALVLYPENKTLTIKSFFLNLHLAINCIGISGIKNVLKREARIKQQHPKTPFIYLWFLGVDPQFQNRGSGSKLLSELIEKSKREQRDIYLETSTLYNVPWYNKFGFDTVKILDFNYSLFVMKRNYGS